MEKLTRCPQCHALVAEPDLAVDMYSGKGKGCSLCGYPRVISEEWAAKGAKRRGELAESERLEPQREREARKKFKEDMELLRLGALLFWTALFAFCVYEVVQIIGWKMGLWSL